MKHGFSLIYEIVNQLDFESLMSAALDKNEADGYISQQFQ